MQDRKRQRIHEALTAAIDGRLPGKDPGLALELASSRVAMGSHCTEVALLIQTAADTGRPAA